MTKNSQMVKGFVLLIGTAKEQRHRESCKVPSASRACANSVGLHRLRLIETKQYPCRKLSLLKRRENC